MRRRVLIFLPSKKGAGCNAWQPFLRCWIATKVAYEGRKAICRPTVSASAEREKLYAFMTRNAVCASEYIQICRVALSWDSRFLTSLCCDASSRLTSRLELLHFNVTQPRAVDR